MATTWTLELGSPSVVRAEESSWNVNAAGLSTPHPRLYEFSRALATAMDSEFILCIPGCRTGAVRGTTEALLSGSASGIISITDHFVDAVFARAVPLPSCQSGGCEDDESCPEFQLVKAAAKLYSRTPRLIENVAGAFAHQTVPHPPDVVTIMGVVDDVNKIEINDKTCSLFKDEALVESVSLPNLSGPRRIGVIAILRKFFLEIEFASLGWFVFLSKPDRCAVFTRLANIPMYGAFVLMPHARPQLRVAATLVTETGIPCIPPSLVTVHVDALKRILHREAVPTADIPGAVFVKAVHENAYSPVSYDSYDA